MKDGGNIMTKTHRATKITALVLTFIMLFSVVCIAGTASAGAATGTDIVSLYSAGKTFSKYGNTSFEVFIKTNHVARFQNVLVHYHYLDGEWRDAYASCIKTFDDGSKIWKASFNSFDCVYAIRYAGDGVVAWDNNNGKDYSYDDVIGPGAAVAAERLGYQYSMENYKINAVLQNYAYHKEVFVRYTTNGWKTCQDKPLSYTKTNANGTETWTTFVNAAHSTYTNFQYAICYRVNGCEFWANNHGANYDFNYCIHQ